MKGLGNGVLATSCTTLFTASQSVERPIYAGDYDADGDEDILAYFIASAEVIVYVNTGGSFR